MEQDARRAGKAHAAAAGVPGTNTSAPSGGTLTTSGDGSVWLNAANIYTSSTHVAGGYLLLREATAGGEAPAP